MIELIDGLPAASRLSAALMMDEEIAEQILDADDENDQEWSPALVEFTLTNQLLLSVIDKLSSVETTLIKVNGGNARSPKPMPTPRTAVTIVRERRSKEAQKSIIQIFAPSHIQET